MRIRSLSALGKTGPLLLIRFRRERSAAEPALAPQLLRAARLASADRSRMHLPASSAGRLAPPSGFRARFTAGHDQSPSRQDNAPRVVHAVFDGDNRCLMDSVIRGASSRRAARATWRESAARYRPPAASSRSNRPPWSAFASGSPASPAAARPLGPLDPARDVPDCQFGANARQTATE